MKNEKPGLPGLLAMAAAVFIVGVGVLFTYLDYAHPVHAQSVVAPVHTFSTYTEQPYGEVNITPALVDMHFKSISIYALKRPQAPVGVVCGVKAYVEDWNNSILSTPVMLPSPGYSSDQVISLDVAAGGHAAIVVQSYGNCTVPAGELNVVVQYTN